MKLGIKNKKGFTLIEMLIVVVIIGILAAVILPKMGSSSRTARVSACRANVGSINTGLELIIFEQNIVESSVVGSFLTTGNYTEGTTYLGVIPGVQMASKFPTGGLACPVRQTGENSIYNVVNGRVDFATHAGLVVGDHP
ncbi:MAG: hypothetical protein A2X42_07345 [Candidatus Margulisbacteria bacterium GWF2_38_17]|nr:MAG: hypothetical protein A2X43_03700 [Candidatus Margulisbacteria bacterium GWD2_39_127]OGI02482.1 MAG: hypothetical protein A2X42_07345 [Candidatus Margulisbacteria bacterium GWF2_38_17]OGI10975.1 MAG: hypothetical protein A2X41_01870 [Candidatus Margulisbacteria bacterium GWE2_39_32]